MVESRSKGNALFAAPQERRDRSCPLLHKPNWRSSTSSTASGHSAGRKPSTLPTLALSTPASPIVTDGWSRSELFPSFRCRLREIRLPGHPLAHLGQSEFNGSGLLVHK